MNIFKKISIALTLVLAAISVVAIANFTMAFTNNTAKNEFNVTYTRPDTMTVVLNANGGTLPTAADGTTGVALTFWSGTYAPIWNDSHKPTRTGYLFQGYSTSSSATEADSTFNFDRKVRIVEQTTLYAVWTPGIWTVTLDLNGKTATNSATRTTAIYEKYNTGYYTNSTATTQMTTSANGIVAPEATGYTFNGYYDAATNGTQYIAANGKLTSTASTSKFSDNSGKLYAHWTANTYTVTLNKQNGSDETDSVIATYDSAMPTATAPSRTGYTFGGYFTGENGTGTQYYNYAAPGQNMGSTRNWDIADNKTLYAKWTNNTYSVTFAANGGTITKTSLLDSNYKFNTNASYDTAYQISAYVSAITRTGYTFTGWKVTAGLNSDVAKYGASSSPSTPIGSDTLIPNNNYFKNINAASNAVTLTAQWRANIYTITLDMNDKTASNSGTRTTAIYEKYANGYYLEDSCTNKMTTSSNAITVPTVTGYTFVGYFTGQNNDTKYIDANGYLTSTASTTNFTNAGTLYAHWTNNTYSVTFNAGGGSMTTSGLTNNAFTASYDTAYKIETYVTAIEKTGYTFDGWKVTAGLNSTVAKYGSTSSPDTQISSSTKMASTDYFKNINAAKTAVTITAQWTANRYEITFDATKNGGSVSGGTLGSGNTMWVVYETTNKYTTESGSTAAAFPTATKSRTGYTVTFKGWYSAYTGGNLVINTSGTVQASVSGYTNSSSQWVPTANKTLYAQFQEDIITYTLTVNYYSSLKTNATDLTVTQADSLVRLKTDTTTTSQTSASVSAPSTNNSPADANRITVSHDYSTTALSVTLARKNTSYVYYIGYSTDTTSPLSTDSTTNSTTYSWTPNENGTYSINVFIAQQYVISYNNNGGSGTMTATNKMYGTAVNLRSNTFTKTGYNFTGWKAGNASTGTAYANSATYSANASTTMYAQWAAAYWEVTVNPHGGSVKLYYNSTNTTKTANFSIYALYDSNKLYYGDNKYEITKIESTRTGYDHDGYFTAATDGTKLINSSSAYTLVSNYPTNVSSWNSTPTIHAQWTNQTYNITYLPASGWTHTGGATTYTFSESSQTKDVGTGAKTGYTNSSKTPSVGSISGTTLTIPAGNTGDITVTFGFTAIYYAITLAPNNGSLKISYNSTNTGWLSSNTTVYGLYDSNKLYYKVSSTYYEITSLESSRTGYTHNGYYQSSTKRINATESHVLTSNFTSSITSWNDTPVFTADWSIITYTLTVHYNNQKSTTATNMTVTAPSGYTVSNSGSVASGNITVSHTYDTTEIDVTIGSSGSGYYIAIGEDCSASSSVNSKVYKWTPDENGTKTINVNIAQRYTITYGGNSSTSGSTESQYKVHGTNLTLRANGYSKTGHTFSSWNTKANGSGNSYAASGTYSANADATLYAQWTINTYTLTVNYYSQKATNNTTLTVAQASSTVTGSPVAKPTTNGSSYTSATVSHDYSTTALSVTLTATNNNGTTINYYIKEGAAVTASDGPANTVTYSWTPDENGNKTINVYIAQKYSITYAAGPATSGSAPATQYKIHETNINLATNSGSYAKTGYTPVGWSTSNNDLDGTPNYTFGATYSTNANLALYPAFSINTYTLTINYYSQKATNNTTLTIAQANSTVTGSPVAKPTTNGSSYTSATVSHDYSTTALSVTLTAANNNGTTVNYYIKEGAAVATDNSPFINTGTYSWTPDENGTYAINIYIAQKYSITYDGNNKTGGTVPSTQYKIHGTDVTLATNSLTRTGYTKNAWNTNASGTGTHYNNGAKYSTDANLVLYAQWTINTYSITVTVNVARNSDADNAPQLQAILDTTGTDYTSSAVTWSYNSSTVTLTIPNVPYNTTGDIKVKWTNTTNCSYVISASDITATQNSVTSKNTYVTINSSYTQGADDASKTAYAKQVYAMSYNANGGSGTVPATKYKVYNVAYTVSSTAPTTALSGFTFIGYNTTDSATTTISSYTNNSAQTFYAIWRKTLSASFYQITATSASSTLSSYVYNGDTATTWTATTPTVSTVSGFATVVGWGNSTSATTATLSSNASSTITNGATYYAICKTNLTLTYNNGGKVLTNTLPSSQNADRFVTANKTATPTYSTVNFTVSSTTPTATGYTFSSWSKSTGGTCAPSDTLSNVTTSTTLTAQWTANIYTITLDMNDKTASNSGTRTTAIYEKYATGYYLEDSCTNKMETNANGIVAPTATGYTFNGYYDAATNGTQYIDANGKLTSSASTTKFSNNSGKLYAHWTNNTYSVTFNAGGGSMTTSGLTNNAFTASYDTAYKINTYVTAIEKTGYTFDGWKVTAGLNSTVAKYGSTSSPDTQISSSTKMASTDYFKNINAAKTAVTITAQWTANRYQITFDATTNGGSVTGGDLGTGNTMWVEYDSASLYKTKSAASATAAATILPTASKTRTGYAFTFKGWYSASSGGSLVISSAKAVQSSVTNYTGTSSIWVPTADKTLYAQFTETAKTYTLTANANGGSIADTTGWTVAGGRATATKTVTYDSTYGTLPTVTRTGYTFDGWFTAETGGSQVSSGTSYTTDAASTIWAHWTINSFTLTLTKNTGISTIYYKINGESNYRSTTSSTTASVTYDTTWYAYATPSTGYNNPTNYSEATAYSATMGIDGATFAPTTTLMTYTITISVVNGSGGTTKTIGYDSTVTTSGNTITFGETAQNEETSVTVTKGSDTGYTFGDTATWSPSSGRITGAATYTATFEKTANTYTLTLNANGGTVDYHADWSRIESNTKSWKNVTYDSAIGTMPSATRTGHEFAGWFTAQSGGTQITLSTVYNSTNLAADDYTLYAHWTLKIFNITLDPVKTPTNTPTTPIYEKYNTGYYLESGCTNKMTTSANPVATVPIVTGYTFTGYWTAASGGTKYIEDNGCLSSSASTTNFTANGTLYAQYTANKYSVTLDPKGGSIVIGYSGGATSSTTSNVTVYAEYDSTTLYYKVSDNDYRQITSISTTKTGYKHTGYWTADSGDDASKVINASTAYVLNSNWTSTSTTTVYYARWTANRYEITFNASRNGGSISGGTLGTGNKMYVVYDSTSKYTTSDGNTAAVIPSATKSVTGYTVTFKGWYTTKDGGTQVINASGTVQASVSNYTGAGSIWKVTQPRTLYAQFTETINTYTLTISYKSSLVTNATQLTVTQADSLVRLKTDTTTTSQTSASVSAPSTNGSPTDANRIIVSHTYSTTPLTVTLASANGNYAYYVKHTVAVTTGSDVNSTTFSWTPSGFSSYNVYIGQQYTVTYNGNNNTGGTVPSVQYKVHGTAVKLATNDLTRTSYTANGWNTNGGGTGTHYNDGATYSENANLYLYAQWTNNTYTLTVNYYSSLVTDATDLTVTQADSLVRLMTDTTTTSQTSASVSAPSTNGSPADANKIIVSHTYSTTPLTVTLSGAFGNNSYYIGTSAVTTGSDLNITTFPWTPTGNGSIDVYIGERYRIIYDENDGTGGTSSSYQYKVHGTNITLSANAYTKTGYTANGWNTNSSGTGTHYDSEATYSANSSILLYAQWTAKRYMVSLNKQGGTGGTDTVWAFYNSPMSSATAPTKTGYTFGGYYSSTDYYSYQQYYDASMNSVRNWNIDGSTILYAKWTVNTYTVTLAEKRPTFDNWTFYTWSGEHGATSTASNFTNHTRNGEMDTFTFLGTGIWEHVYYPVSMTSGKTYKFTYDYVSPAYSYTNNEYSPNSGMRLQLWKTLPQGNGGPSSSVVANDIIPASSSGTRTLTYACTASKTYYLSFNFGWAGNGTSQTWSLGNFSLSSASVTATYGSAMPSASTPTANPVDTRGYVYSDLYVWYDGYYNYVSAGNPSRSTTTSTWYDLMGHVNASTSGSKSWGTGGGTSGYLLLNSATTFARTASSLPTKMPVTYEIRVYIPSGISTAHIIDHRTTDANESGTQPMYFDSAQGIQMYSPSGSGYLGKSAVYAGNYYTLTVVSTDGYSALYVNGVYQGAVSQSSNTIASAPITLGARCRNTNTVLNQGRIYSFRYYNRALTEDEIGQNYAADIKNFVDNSDGEFMGYYSADGKRYYSSAMASTSTWDITSDTTLYARRATPTSYFKWGDGSSGYPTSKIIGFSEVGYKSGVKDIVLPSGCTAIGDNAFRYDYWTSNTSYHLSSKNSGIRSVTLSSGSSLTSIGNYAFSDCSLTGGLYIPSTVTSIGNYAFNNCSGLTGTLTLPSGLTSIGDYTFYNCSGFTGTLTLPSGLTSIGDVTFLNCSGFTGTLTLPSGLTSIGDDTFRNCSGFTGTLTLPSGLTSIGDHAFYGCTGFSALSMNQQAALTTIGSYAFQNCTGLGSIVLPNGLTTIGSYAFNGCTSISGALTIPSYVTSIGGAAFNGCSGLSGTVTILAPAGRSCSIGDYAFENCSNITGLTLGAGVSSIGSAVFRGCSKLACVTFNHTSSTLSSLTIANPSVSTSSSTGNITLARGAFKEMASNPTYVFTNATVSNVNSWGYFNVIWFRKDSSATASNGSVSVAGDYCFVADSTVTLSNFRGSWTSSPNSSGSDYVYYITGSGAQVALYAKTSWLTGSFNHWVYSGNYPVDITAQSVDTQQITQDTYINWTSKSQ